VVSRVLVTPVSLQTLGTMLPTAHSFCFAPALVGPGVLGCGMVLGEALPLQEEDDVGARRNAAVAWHPSRALARVTPIMDRKSPLLCKKEKGDTDRCGNLMIPTVHHCPRILRTILYRKTPTMHL
jgi:hypothetical protein